MLSHPKIHLLCPASDDFPRLLSEAARRSGWSVETHSTAEALLAELRLQDHGVLLIAPGADGPLPAMELTRHLRARRINLPVLLVVSGEEPHALEVAAVHSGAHDVIRVPASAEQVRRQVSLALKYDRQGASRPGAVRSRLATLSGKEREVMELALAGESTNAMASALGVVYQTINKHRARIRMKMRAKSDISLLHQLLGQPPLPAELGYAPADPIDPAAAEPTIGAPLAPVPNASSSPATAESW